MKSRILVMEVCDASRRSDPVELEVPKGTVLGLGTSIALSILLLKQPLLKYLSQVK